jgi:hypothetical protein
MRESLKHIESDLSAQLKALNATAQAKLEAHWKKHTYHEAKFESHWEHLEDGFALHAWPAVHRSSPVSVSGFLGDALVTPWGGSLWLPWGYLGVPFSIPRK